MNSAINSHLQDGVVTLHDNTISAFSLTDMSLITLAIIPLFFVMMGLVLRWKKPTDTLLRFITWFTVIGLILSLLILAAVYNGNVSTAEQALFSLAPLNIIVLSLILLIASVLLSFSRNYMRGEACIARYFSWMLLTLAAVTVTVMSNHLLIFWLGWVSISLGLHRLLTLYPERRRAMLAAHKKFILARCAESLLLVAFLILYSEYGTLYIQHILDALSNTYSSDVNVLTWQPHLAAVLIALAALIKSAQLPVHGWLIKVVETPTPVSALLHAGIINLGGFVLITFAPLFSQAIVAQWLVLIVAGISTLLAALIMTTRISMKVRLAWSTSAQMGMMLIQCALGLYELALLHLVLHSIYKAYSFLHAGNAVNDHIKQRITQLPHLQLGNMMLSAAWTGLCVLGVIILLGDQGPWSLWLLLGLALTSLMSYSANQNTTGRIHSVVLVAFLAAVYGLLKWGAEYALDFSHHFAVSAFSAADNFIAIIILVLFVTNIALTHYANHPKVQQLSARLFAGLYLDEWFTRTTLVLWPTPLPKVVNSAVNSTVNSVVNNHVDSSEKK